MGFVHPPLLNLARQPKGNDSSKSIMAMVGRNCRLKVTCKTRLRVENASRRKRPLSQKPTQEPQPTPTPTPDQYSQTFAYQVGNVVNLNLIATATAIALVLVWVIVILGYAAKGTISKYRVKK